LCVAAGRNDIERLVLVAPPVAMAEALPWNEISQPIHVVVGSSDTFAPHESLRRILTGLPGSCLDVIDGADHFFASGLREVERCIARR
jgi:alpha/beta superfamily hydrolase